MAWRKITADQYRLGTDDEGFDEAYVIDPANGFRRELWDVGCDLDEDGNVVLYTSAANPTLVLPTHPIEVR